MCKLEGFLPESEWSIFTHCTLHLADMIGYWNNTRNYWCFTCERFVGYCKKFVHNRSLAVENLVRE